MSRAVVPAALLPAVALVAGAAAGILQPFPWRWLLWVLPALVLVAWSAWFRQFARSTLVASVVAFGIAGFILGSDSREKAIDAPLRLDLDREFGGFRVGAADITSTGGPVAARLLLMEDASLRDDQTTLRARVRSIRLHGTWMPSDGGVVVTVGGGRSGAHVAGWRRGRTIEAPVTFRRPARYLDDGVPDFERDAALAGISLLGSIKSALLVEVVHRGSVASEFSADVRARVRRALARHVGIRSPLSAAIVSAVLIGDRSGLPDDVRARLQAAGTYHVIAISGGNIAILAALILLVLGPLGVSGRRAAAVTLVLLIAYAGVVTAGPSVWRATLVAIVYLVARLFDHRSPPWQAMAVAGALLAVADPLDVRDAGFVLTFGATAALLEVARHVPFAISSRWSNRRWVSWLAASLIASAAVEIVLLPVMALTFSRVTVAGLVLNLVAVPAMTVVQVAGLVVVCADAWDAIGLVAGWIAHIGAAAIVESARLVDVAPWLSARVAPAASLVIAAYYAGLSLTLLCRRRWQRIAGLTCIAAMGVLIVTGARQRADPPGLRLTMFDVGQGDAMVLQVNANGLMIDTGGSPFGGGAFDIGSRVVQPALWARGINSLHALLLTHGDPDHIGGAIPVIDGFQPTTVWQGIPVPGARSLAAVLARASTSGAAVAELREAETFRIGEARVVVLHPFAPDWERRNVRNDDSVVVEVLYGDVALLLTGDVSADIERTIVPRLIPAKTRILKVAHHGSRTSTSQELLDAWRPQIALISCGRANPFGHPAPDVIARLETAGTRIYRTDRDGEITLDTDGQHVVVWTFAGEKP